MWTKIRTFEHHNSFQVDEFHSFQRIYIAIFETLVLIDMIQVLVLAFMFDCQLLTVQLKVSQAHTVFIRSFIWRAHLDRGTVHI